jgi:hypothetical protein
LRISVICAPLAEGSALDTARARVFYGTRHNSEEGRQKKLLDTLKKVWQLEQNT